MPKTKTTTATTAIRIMRALGAAEPSGLTPEQIERLLPGSGDALAEAMADDRVVRSYRMDTRLVITAYGQAWLAVRRG